MRSASLAAGAVGAAAVAAVVLGAGPATASAPVLKATTPMCATSQLTASLGGGDAAAGSLYRILVVTNHSGTTCHLTGYPGLSLLDASGKQIGAPATYQHLAYAPVVLRPGASASDTIHTINHQGTCLPTSAKLRIYPPGNRDALVFPGQVTNCDNQFIITPLLAGTGGNPSSQSTTPPTSTPVPTATSGTGAQVPTVPSGAPDTGLRETSQSSGAPGEAAMAAGGGILAAGVLGLAFGLRRKSHARAQG